LQAATRRFKREKRGISTVIVVMLSLALLVTVVGNMVLWSYQMNQLDMERMQETVSIKNVTQSSGTCLEIKNSSPTSARIVAIWVTEPTDHHRYSADLFLNSGETLEYIRTDVVLPKDFVLVKIVTERGNVAVFSADLS
jgi:uncharacterized membrane protein YeiB